MRADLWPAVEAGKLSLPIDKTFALDDIAAALAMMKANAAFREDRCFYFISHRHSGAQRSWEPGIHNPGAGSMDSGLAASRQSGMTPDRETA